MLAAECLPLSQGHCDPTVKQHSVASLVQLQVCRWLPVPHGKLLERRQLNFIHYILSKCINIQIVPYFRQLSGVCSPSFRENLPTVGQKANGSAVIACNQVMYRPYLHPRIQNFSSCRQTPLLIFNTVRKKAKDFICKCSD